jgi:uncharacterized protein YciI
VLTCRYLCNTAKPQHKHETDEPITRLDQPLSCSKSYDDAHDAEGDDMNFSILIYDEPESAALRDEHRTAHLSYLKVFDADTQFAGPFTTDDESADLGSLRLISFPDRAAAEKHIADEPYVIAGIQKRWQIHRWTPAQSSTWRETAPARMATSKLCSMGQVS